MRALAWIRRPAVRTAVGGGLLAFGLFATTATGTDEPTREDPRVELGRRLFFDPSASRLGMRSCADCHDPRHGYSDRAPVSRDDRSATIRHSQTLVDGARNPSAHWDGAFRRVDDLVVARLTLASGTKGSVGHGLGVGKTTPSGQRRDTGSSSAGGYGNGGAPPPTRDDGSTSEQPYSAGQPGNPVTGTQPDPGESEGEGENDGYGGSEGDEESDENVERDHCPNGMRAPNGEGGREPTDPAPAPSEPAPPPATPPPSGVVPPSPGAAAPSESAPDSTKEPAKEPAKRPDPYAEDAFGTRPEEGIEFVALDLDVTRHPQAAEVLGDAGRYAESFQAAYGSPGVSLRRIAEAIGAYCDSIRSGESAYDRFVQGDRAALSPAARRGLDLFEGRAACASCHALRGPRAEFTDYTFHDTGVSWKALPAKTDADRAKIADSTADAGAAAATTRPADRRAFKTPTLRDVSRRGPFFHDGSAQTLEDAVRHYVSGPIGDPLLDERMPRMRATEEEVADLVAFLRSLTSRTRPGKAASAWAARAERVRLRFVDADKKPLDRWPVTIAPAGDELPGAGERAPIQLVTDAQGVVEFAPFATTHARILLEGGLRPEGGSWIPDTCRDAEIRVPVRGTASLAVTFGKGEPVPEALVAEHPRARFFPDRRVPRTILRRVSAISMSDGKNVALYMAPFRTDVPATASLRLPRPKWGLDRLQVVLDDEKRATVDLSR